MPDDVRMRDVVLVTGPPGAGKSSVAEHLVSLLDPSAYVAGDLFFGFVRRGYIKPWLPEAKDQNALVIEAAALAVGRLARRFHVVYDGVVGPWYLPTFADTSGLDVLHYAMLLPPLSVCVERVASRAEHGFTNLDATRHMWDDFERSRRGIQSRVIDDVASPEALAQQIAHRVADGSLRYDLGSDEAT